MDPENSPEGSVILSPPVSPGDRSDHNMDAVLLAAQLGTSDQLIETLIAYGALSPEARDVP